MRSRICFLLALVALAAHPDGTALAQTPPASCKPNAGGTQECAPEFPGPYKYLPLTCGAPYVDSESAANSIWEAASLPTIQQCPGSTYVDTGWVPKSAPMCSNGYCGPGYQSFSVTCGGSPSLEPVTTNGIETLRFTIPVGAGPAHFYRVKYSAP